MKMRSFSASCMSEAMNLVREEMGENAVILSTRDARGGGVQITAAIEEQEPAAMPAWEAAWDATWREEEVEEKDARPRFGSNDTEEAELLEEEPLLSPKAERLIQALAYHGLPTVQAEKLCRIALDLDHDNPELTLAAALDARFGFAPITLPAKKPLMLVGPPGVGKTQTVAKFATATVLSGTRVTVITTDTRRAGGIEQLEAFTRLLGVELLTAERPADLKEILSGLPAAARGSVLIDTAGANAYSKDDMTGLAARVVAAGAEPVLVLAAGADPAEMADQTEAFCVLGAHRMVVTRLDTTRRYGGIFTAAETSGLKFANTSISPSAAEGLYPINPVSLARLLLRDPTTSGIDSEFNKGKP